TKRAAESCQHLLGVADREEVDSSRVQSLEETDFQLPHKASRRHPEVISHHDDTLQSPTIALPQGLHQVRVLFFLFRMKPLLQLVEDGHHLFADGTPSPWWECSQCLSQT